jgi:hypothetical protein
MLKKEGRNKELPCGVNFGIMIRHRDWLWYPWNVSVTCSVTVEYGSIKSKV